MTNEKAKAVLLEVLSRCASLDDTESAHAAADEALIDYIDDAEIAEAYDRVDKWYA